MGFPYKDQAQLANSHQIQNKALKLWRTNQSIYTLHLLSLPTNFPLHLKPQGP